MAEELLSLKWNNHQTHFVDILTFLREQEIFIDATLACGGKLYPAHKFVLSTCSDYFKQMFTKNPNKHPIVFMKDVSCRDLEALLDFMYNGEVNVPQSSLGSLIKTAEGLQIKGLAVPDDPPVPKRDIGVVRERRDLKATRDNSYSPPPKRLRAREKSPHLGSSASLFSSVPVVPSRARSPSLPTVTAGLMPLEASLDEDSRTSAQSALSEHSPSLNSKPNLNSQPHVNNEDSTSQSDHTNQHNQQQSKSEPSPGPSGLHKPQSKEEEMDIKQEDVVDLGEADEGEWGGEGGEGSVDDGGGGDSLASENAPNFSDVLVPPSDGSLNTTGDPAMGLIPDLTFHPMVIVDEGILRPHRCTYCGRRFKRKDHRAEHERIHTGERPFVCLACGRAFIQKHQLVSHTKRKHHYAPATEGQHSQPQQQPQTSPSSYGSSEALRREYGRSSSAAAPYGVVGNSSQRRQPSLPPPLPSLDLSSSSEEQMLQREFGEPRDISEPKVSDPGGTSRNSSVAAGTSGRNRVSVFPSLWSD